MCQEVSRYQSLTITAYEIVDGLFHLDCGPLFLAAAGEFMLELLQAGNVAGAAAAVNKLCEIAQETPVLDEPCQKESLAACIEIFASGLNDALEEALSQNE